MTKKRFRKYIIGFWGILLALFLGVILFFAGISWGWFGDMPTFEELENPKSNLASEIYSADQVLLGKYYVENRSNTHYSKLSPHLVNALLATEDIRFRSHAGIDLKSLFRVAYGVMTGTHRGGGSTITQQLAKNLFPRESYLSTPELVMRKFKEWITAVKLERNYSKNEIIAMYLNTVSFGSNSFGIKSASRTFFNKSPMELKIEEAAVLVGVVNAPTRYSPIINPDAATDRRNLVLHQMATYDFIKEKVADSLQKQPIDMSEYNVMSHKSGMARYFREHIRGKLKTWCQNHYKPNGEPYNLYKDGLKIYTTINSKMQQYAEEAVKEHLREDLQPAFDKHWEGHENAPFEFDTENPEKDIKKLMESGMRRSPRYKRLQRRGVEKDSIKKIFHKKTKMRVFSWQGEKDTVMTPWDSIRYYKSILQAGLMSMEPRTGYVRAYVGGPDYEHFKYDHVTYSQRQVGSTFKPFLYTLAMQEGGVSPCTKVPNVQTRIETGDGEFWAPENPSDDRIGEMVSLKWALAHSNNWISAYLIKKYSPQSVKKITRKMGVTSPFPAVPAIALGTPDMSLYEMVGALNTYVNRGIHIEPIFLTRIEDKNGNILERFIPEQQEAMSEETAYLMLEMLKGVVNKGTGRRLRWKYGFDQPIAGKTGTTQNQSDGWFIGMVPNLATGIWVGAEDRAAHFRNIKLGQGANMALPIWAKYMKRIYADSSIRVPKKDFAKPDKPLSVEINCEQWEKNKSQQNNRINEDEF